MEPAAGVDPAGAVDTVPQPTPRAGVGAGQWAVDDDAHPNGTLRRVIQRNGGRPHHRARSLSLPRGPDARPYQRAIHRHAGRPWRRPDPDAPDARASAAHTGRPRLQVRDQPSPDAPYPRRIEHAEVVEYGYDSASDTYSVDVKEASRPEVVGYDDTPPDPLEREVGGWEVTPSGRRVESDENDDMAEDLREEAPGRKARPSRARPRPPTSTPWTRRRRVCARTAQLTTTR